MSFGDDLKDALLDEAAALLVKLPVECIKLIVGLARDALTSEDPTRLIERRVTADAAHLASQETLATALRARTKQK